MKVSNSQEIFRILQKLSQVEVSALEDLECHLTISKIAEVSNFAKHRFQISKQVGVKFNKLFL